jgi:hypothetical protein
VGQRPPRVYLKELHDKWDYWASWLPGRKTRVGDCGPLNGVVFNNENSLKVDFGIPVEVEPSDVGWPSLEHTSSGAVTITPSVKATTAVGTQEVTVKFKRANGVVFGANTVQETSMKNRGAVAKQLSDLVRAGAFPADWVVATDVLEASSLTAMVSISSGEAVKVQVAGPVGTPIGPAALAAGIEAAGSSASTIRIVGGQNATPMFKLMMAPRRPPDTFGDKFGVYVQDQWKAIFKRPNPPRFGYIKIASNVLGGMTVGQSIEVQPYAGQKIMVSSLEGETLHLGTERWGSMTIKPLVVSDVRQWLNDVAYTSEEVASFTAPQVDWLDPEYMSTGEVKVHLMDDFPLVIEQPSGELFLARPLSPVSVTLHETVRRQVPQEATAPVEYVDFNSVYAATEGSGDE